MKTIKRPAVAGDRIIITSRNTWQGFQNVGDIFTVNERTNRKIAEGVFCNDAIDSHCPHGFISDDRYEVVVKDGEQV